MRGSLSLFTDLIPQQPTAVMTVTKQGRSADLHALRNECLVERYHYYLHFTKMRYESVLEVLSREFFIAPFTIQERLTENYDTLLRLKQEQPQKSQLAKKWPHLVWS